MDKIKRFLDCYIPTETCNLRCHYCYIAQKRKFENKLASFRHSKETIRKALSKERLGGTCLLNMCAGGETLLSSEVLPVVKELLEEGHYVMIVTNGTVTKRFEEIIEWPEELKQRLFIKFSFHFLEMKRLNWMELFFNNVRLMRDNGVSFTVEVTPSDELISHIEELKEVCMKHVGAMCHVTVARDDRTGGIDILSDKTEEEYKKLWGQFESALFDFKMDIYHKKQKKFCYAGLWSGYLNLDSGMLRQCYCGKQLSNIYENVDKPIPFEAIGHDCSLPYCYNGHAFLTLGCIPQLQTPTYAQTRERMCLDGTHWLQPKMKSFMSTKLGDSNSEYSVLKKGKCLVGKMYTRCYRAAARAKAALMKRKK